MTVHADIAVGVKVVADGPLSSHGMVVRGDVDIAYTEPSLLPVHVAPGSETRDLRHPHGAGNVAENFIVGAILLNDQHHVLDPGRQFPLRLGARAETVGIHRSE